MLSGQISTQILHPSMPLHKLSSICTIATPRLFAICYLRSEFQLRPQALDHRSRVRNHLHPRRLQNFCLVGGTAADPLDDGAGVEKGKPVNIIGFRYPMMVTYADRSEAEVYEVAKAMDEAFDLYKNVNATTKNWAITKAGRTPADVAWHPGSIKYLKEKGVWSAADEAWNTARMARHAKVIEEWDNATDAFNAWRAAEKKRKNKIKVSEAWPKYWADHRKKVGLD